MIQFNKPTFIRASRIENITHCPELGQYSGRVVLSVQSEDGGIQDVVVTADVMSDASLENVSLALKLSRAAAHLWRLCEVNGMGHGHTQMAA